MDNARLSAGIRQYGPSLLMLGLVVWFLVSAAYHGAIVVGSSFNGVDFGSFYRAADRLNHGQALYRWEPGPYVYSPLLALLLRPLAHLPPAQALKAWFFINAFCLLLSIALYGIAARFTRRDIPLIAVLLLLSFRFWPTTTNFGLGQINFVLLLLVSAIFWADSRGKLRMVGLLIASAALLKTWMLGAILYLLLRRQWRAAAWCLGTFSLAMAGLFTIVGWQEWPLFCKLTAGFANQSIGQYEATQSISGFARLHFLQNGQIQPLVQSVTVFHAVILVGYLAVILGTVTALGKYTPTPASLDARLQMSLLFTSILLLLPMTQNEYFILCLPLFWTMLALKSGDKPVPRYARIICFLIYLLFTRGWPTYPPIAAAYQHGLRSLLVSASFFGAMALWALAVYVLRQSASLQIKPATLPKVRILSWKFKPVAAYQQKEV